ncbi:MAG: cbb3-type cytochrome oxidase maturation protein [Bacteroidia bacterium]|jgi:cbb3-type cytochrome oxidase maturation protein
MKIMVLLIAASLIMAIIFLAIFFWAVKSGQFDDMESPSFRILDDKNKTEK